MAVTRLRRGERRRSGGRRARGRPLGDAPWRGEDVGIDGVDWGGALRRGTGVAAEDAGELRAAAPSLHKKGRKKALRKRHGAGNVKEEAEGRRDVGSDQIEVETVAEMAAPASYRGSLAARWRGRGWGNGRGFRGLLIALAYRQNGAGNQRQ